MNQLRVAVIGTGALGQHHVRNYHELPNTRLVMICDQDRKRAEELSKKYTVPFTTRYEDLVGTVDAVSIATPTFSHYDVAKFFLANGIHTLIEKPITLKLEHADELIALAKEKNLSLQVGHIERHNSAFRRVKKLANKIKFIEIHRLGPFAARIQDCGVVLDLMIHDLDIVLSLIKEPIAYLDAVGINAVSQHEDIANVRIKFANGSIANITASRLTPEKQRKIRIFQNDAYISLDYQAQEVKIFRKSLLGLKQEQLEIEKEEPLKTELSSFVNGILDASALGHPDVDARNALELALRCLDIIRENNKNFMQHG